MGLGAGTLAFKANAVRRADDAIRGALEQSGDRVVNELSPVGDPTLWKRLPSGEYHPGNFRGNWFYSVGEPSKLTREGVGIMTVNGLADMPGRLGGLKHYVSNSTPYAQALEYGHSSQAPAGIIAIIAIELPAIAEAAAKRAAA